MENGKKEEEILALSHGGWAADEEGGEWKRE